MQRKHLPIRIAAGVAAVALTATGFAASRHKLPIDLAEVRAKVEAHFATVDGDGDGLVSAAEFAAVDHREALGGHRHGRRFHGRHGHGDHDGERDTDGIFAAGDRDGDGALSKAEFDALPEAARMLRRQRIFERLDVDADGLLTLDELGARLARLEALDVNGDGQVSRDELPRRRWRR